MGGVMTYSVTSITFYCTECYGFKLDMRHTSVFVCSLYPFHAMSPRCRNILSKGDVKKKKKYMQRTCKKNNYVNYYDKRIWISHLTLETFLVNPLVVCKSFRFSL